MPLSFHEAGELVELVSGLNRQLERSIEAELKPNGLSIEQYRALEALDGTDGVTMGDLAARVFVDGPTMTKIVDRMVASGDVYRAPDPGDRRKVLALLSDKGAESLADARRALRAVRNAPLERLAPGEADQLRSLLHGMLDI